jgi:hypothetical protein
MPLGSKSSSAKAGAPGAKSMWSRARDGARGRLAASERVPGGDRHRIRQVGAEVAERERLVGRHGGGSGQRQALCPPFGHDASRAVAHDAPRGVEGDALGERAAGLGEEGQLGAHPGGR